jgi:hypothetical protein
MLHITSYHHYPLVEFNFIKVISTFHVIDIWTCNEFSMFGHAYFFLSLWFAFTWHVTHQLMFTSLKVHYVKKMIKKFIGPNKRKDVLFFLMFLCFKKTFG